MLVFVLPPIPSSLKLDQAEDTEVALGLRFSKLCLCLLNGKKKSQTCKKKRKEMITGIVM
jgi:hypothetical protein